jgi:hypothetical protein
VKPTTPLQSIVDSFVKRFGGELIESLVGNENPPSNADYLLRCHNVIAELKSLEDDSFGESLTQKFSERMAGWLRRSNIVVFGANRVESRRFAPECQREMADLVAAHLQNDVVKAANRQIEGSKEFLKMPDAKGLLWVASDGNTGLLPDQVWALLNRILQKKHEDGSPQYSNIHALAYFNPRILVRLPGSDLPAVFWFSGARDNEDQQLGACLTELYNAWPTYIACMQGVEVTRVEGNTPSPEGLQFWGVSPRLPQIQIKDSRRAK